MNTTQSLPIIDKACQDAHTWINKTAEELACDEQGAYHAIRGVLFAIRDRIMPSEAVQFADQMPVFIRGIYYEGYTLGEKPEKIRSVKEFLQKISHETEQSEASPEPKQSLLAVTKVIKHNISEGQYEQVKQAVNLELQELFYS